MKTLKNDWSRCFAVPILAGIVTIPAYSDVTLTLTENGADTDFEWSGTFNTAELTEIPGLFDFFGFPTPGSAGNEPGFGVYAFDPVGPPNYIGFDLGAPVVLPASNVLLGLANDSTTPVIGVMQDFFGVGSVLLVPDGYVSGSAIEMTGEFAGLTGMAPGSTTIDLAPGTTGNNFTINVVGGMSPIPEITGSSVLLGVLGMSLFARRRVR